MALRVHFENELKFNEYLVTNHKKVEIYSFYGWLNSMDFNLNQSNYQIFIFPKSRSKDKNEKLTKISIEMEWNEQTVVLHLRASLVLSVQSQRHNAVQIEKIRYQNTSRYRVSP